MLNINPHTLLSFRQAKEKTKKKKRGAKAWAEKHRTGRKRRAGEWKMSGDSGGICPTGILNFHSLLQTHVYTKREGESV